MKKSVCALMVGAALLSGPGLNGAAAAVVNPAPVPVIPGGGANGGPGGAGVVIGLAAFLVTYDLIRRTTCTGDVLGLGGPGFNQPIAAAMNALPPPKCGANAPPASTSDPVVIRAMY